MKKLLIASTALVTTSGFAWAEVNLGGSAQFGVIYQENRTVADGNGDDVEDELYLDWELQFDLSGSTTTDSGLTFGASADFENDSNATADSSDQGFDPEIFVSGGFGTLTIGDLDVATDSAFGGWTLDPGYDGLGIDNKIDTLIFADAGAGFDISGAEIDSNIRYEYAAGGFEFTFTADSFEENYAVALAYEFGDYRVGAGYVDIEEYGDNVNSDGLTLLGGGSSWSIFVGGDNAGFDWNLYYVDHENEALNGPGAAEAEAKGYGGNVAYDLGGYKLLFAANYTEIEDPVSGGEVDGWDYGIGVSYDLGGGASLDAGIGQIYTIEDLGASDTDDQLVASLGMTFKF